MCFKLSVSYNYYKLHKGPLLFYFFYISSSEDWQGISLWQTHWCVKSSLNTMFLTFYSLPPLLEYQLSNYLPGCGKLQLQCIVNVFVFRGRACICKHTQVIHDMRFCLKESMNREQMSVKETTFSVRGINMWKLLWIEMIEMIINNNNLKASWYSFKDDQSSWMIWCLIEFYGHFLRFVCFHFTEITN